MRHAQTRTGITAADFFCICNAVLRRFTFDRLVRIIYGFTASNEMLFTPNFLLAPRALSEMNW